MDIIAFTPPPGVWKGIDTAGDDDSPGNVITPELAAALYIDGMRWVARYTRLDGQVLANPQPGGDYRGTWSLSLREQEDILTAGLGIVPVQYGTFGPAQYGNAVGMAAAETARKYGWDPAVHHFCDVEGGAPTRAGADGVAAYVNQWTQGNTQTRSGMYYTKDFGLGAQGLYRLRGITSYWRAATDPLPPSKRDASIYQRHSTKVCGILCDPDTMIPDRMGSCPTIVATPEIAANWYGEAIGALLSSPHLAV